MIQSFRLFRNVQIRELNKTLNLLHSLNNCLNSGYKHGLNKARLKVKKAIEEYENERKEIRGF